MRGWTIFIAGEFRLSRHPPKKGFRRPPQNGIVPTHSILVFHSIVPNDRSMSISFHHMGRRTLDKMVFVSRIMWIDMRRHVWCDKNMASWRFWTYPPLIMEENGRWPERNSKSKHRDFEANVLQCQLIYIFSDRSCVKMAAIAWQSHVTLAARGRTVVVVHVHLFSMNPVQIVPYLPCVYSLIWKRPSRVEFFFFARFFRVTERSVWRFCEEMCMECWYCFYSLLFLAFFCRCSIRVFDVFQRTQQPHYVSCWACHFVMYTFHVTLILSAISMCYTY